MNIPAIPTDAEINAGADRLFEKMKRVSVVESAIEELDTTGELSPEMEAELWTIGVDPGEFILIWEAGEE